MIFIAIMIIIIIISIVIACRKHNYSVLEYEVLSLFGFTSWDDIPFSDEYVTVKSRQALNNYTMEKFFKENRHLLNHAEKVIVWKAEVRKCLRDFLDSNEYQNRSQYRKIEKNIQDAIDNTRFYRIQVDYISPAGNYLDNRVFSVSQHDINRFKADPSLLMGKGEYNQYLKAQQKEVLNQMQHSYYDTVNRIIDYANRNRSALVSKDKQNQLDNYITQLFDRTVNSIKKVRAVNSEEWEMIGNFISHIDQETKRLITHNQRILDYYQSADFRRIKQTCEVLMSSQREFNEYITEKVETLSQLFGTRIMRNETVTADEYQYIRPYQKTLTPFTAEVSAAVFASAENNPIDYIVKNFYANKELYPEQIRKLHLLIEELETLKEAKQIIENHKLEYQQYLGSVPDYVLNEDEAGFYARLGFANIDESVLTVEYTFSYTSGGGMAKRSFGVPMTEENIIALINALESKLTAKAFSKEQRALMTKKLRDHIKNRDNFTCCNCGNSTHREPNLLLEIDHIVPVSKGGYTVENNLQTLCWKCNRAKSSKLVY